MNHIGFGQIEQIQMGHDNHRSVGHRGMDYVLHCRWTRSLDAAAAVAIEVAVVIAVVDRSDATQSRSVDGCIRSCVVTIS